MTTTTRRELFASLLAIASSSPVMRHRAVAGASRCGLWSLAGLAALLAGGRIAARERPVFRTPLCDLLGIDYPVLQAPMPGIATPPLVAAVGEAGGLGILGGIGLTPDELRKQIREVRALTRRPFGVNLIDAIVSEACRAIAALPGRVRVSATA